LGAVVSERWFADYVPGATVELGPFEVEEAEMLDFARRFDPQPFHVDAGQAAAGPYSGLIASGWHTCALMMRLLTDDYLSPVSSLGSPGIDQLRWVLPVRPGDELTVRATVADSRLSRSQPDRGVVTTGIEVRNQADDVVLRMVAIDLVLIRPTGSG
jgi:acyl dehydratase